MSIDRCCLQAWWRHQMETFSALLALCAGNSTVPGEFPTQRPVTRSFDVNFDLRLNKLLCKQSWGWWFETLLCPLWRHSNGDEPNRYIKVAVKINEVTWAWCDPAVWVGNPVRVMFGQRFSPPFLFKNQLLPRSTGYTVKCFILTSWVTNLCNEIYSHFCKDIVSLTHIPINLLQCNTNDFLKWIYTVNWLYDGFHFWTTHSNIAGCL